MYWMISRRWNIMSEYIPEFSQKTIEKKTELIRLHVRHLYMAIETHWNWKGCETCDSRGQILHCRIWNPQSPSRESTRKRISYMWGGGRSEKKKRSPLDFLWTEDKSRVPSRARQALLPKFYSARFGHGFHQQWCKAHPNKNCTHKIELFSEGKKKLLLSVPFFVSEGVDRRAVF